MTNTHRPKKKKKKNGWTCVFFFFLKKIWTSCIKIYCFVICDFAGFSFFSFLTDLGGGLLFFFFFFFQLNFSSLKKPVLLSCLLPAFLWGDPTLGRECCFREAMSWICCNLKEKKGPPTRLLLFLIFLVRHSSCCYFFLANLY